MTTYENEIDQMRQGERSGHMPWVLGTSTLLAVAGLLTIAAFTTL